ncbi:MAG TPA: hypothetical protein VF062_15760 [Candidatus Limnocylindrales bacterium]
MVLTTLNIGLAAVLTGFQFWLGPAAWTVQQWVFAVILPATALVTQATGGLAVWWWSHRRGARPVLPVLVAVRPGRHRA